MREQWLDTLTDLNCCSQKGLVERFDGSIGAGCVFMPYGGKYQLTETQSMVAKLPVLKGKCDTVTMMAMALIRICRAGVRITGLSMRYWSLWHASSLPAEITGRSALRSRNISAE